MKFSCSLCALLLITLLSVSEASYGEKRYYNPWWPRMPRKAAARPPPPPPTPTQDHDHENYYYWYPVPSNPNTSNPSPPTPTPPPPPSPTPTPVDNSLVSQFLIPHNAARSQARVPPLQWDSSLEAFAQSWANQRAATGNCQLQHSNGPYGENIFWGYGKPWSAGEAVQAWVDEKQFYDYSSNSCKSGEQCGHYTQIVWKSSTRLGCARVTCSSGSVFITCNYDPPGNYIGERPY